MPQKRERVIIVGFRKDLNVEFDFPEAVVDSPEKYVPLSKVIDSDVDDKYFFSQKSCRWNDEK